MTKNTINYFDFSTPLLGEGVKNSLTNVKIPAYNIHDFYFYIEKVFQINIDRLSCVVIYRKQSNKGYTNITFKKTRLIDGLELKQTVLHYKKIRRKYL